MTGDDDTIQTALENLPDGPLHIARELRLMADAAPPYTRFTYISPLIKNIWRAAANILEDIFAGNQDAPN